MNDFTALRGIMAPGTSVYGYHRGAPVSAQVVDSWDLKVGDVNDPEADVVAGDLPQDAPDTPVVARPDEGANRAAWESYAMAHGMSAADVAGASMDDLMATGTSEQGERPDRPADSAKKADWVTYAEAMGADPAWAGADTTTKADLQAYEPPVGDTVAKAASDAQG